MVRESPTPVMGGAPGPVTVIDGRPYDYFAGTSYLGLAGDPEVIEAACVAVRRYGVHSATSRTGFGNNPATLEVERLAAGFFGREAAFYFASGYVGNHIVVQALAAEADAVLVDEATHYCLHEAARLAGRPVWRFRHGDPAGLEECLREHLQPGQRPLVLTEGVFAVTGRVAPVPDYLRVLERFGPALLHLDDAHGFGVLGEEGRGTLEHHGLWDPGVNAGDKPTLTACGTLSKALGGFGGILPGAAGFIRRARGASHYFDGASAPSSADAGATAKALEIVRQQPGLRRQLKLNIASLRAGLRALGLGVADGPAANFSVEIGGAANMRRIHEALKVAGILVPYVAAYSGLGPEGALRFAVCARHTLEQIGQLLSTLRKIV